MPDFAGILGGISIALAGAIAYDGLRTAWSYVSLKKDAVGERITGKWKGNFQQADDSGNPSTVDLTMRLNAGRRRVKGTGQYKGPDGDETVNVEGGFVDSRRLVLSYKNADSAKLQHGQMILKLSNVGSSLDGGFVGLGLLTDRVVFGPVQLKKKMNRA